MAKVRRKTHRSGGRVFDTMSQCCGFKDVTMAELTALKRAGCPGFRGHYVEWRKVQPWLKRARARAAREALGDLELQVLRERFRAEALDGK
jgi:hypothetical protein